MVSIEVIIRQMILSALRNAQITSANPTHTNTVKEISLTGEIGTEEEFKESIRDMVQEMLDDPITTQSIAENELTKEKKKGITESQKVGLASKAVSTAKNPGSIVAQGLAFLPHAVLVSFAISLAPFIFDQLTRPGGPLDLRFKRIVDDEINAFLSRQTQKDTELGIRQVIIQSKKGFTASNGVNNYNTQKGIREGGFDKQRLDRFGMIDHSKGLFDFG